MPFAPFVSVNHHGSSIVFASALISHEDADTLELVFNKLRICMGKAPLGILTNQDKAIGKVVEKVFPGVPHRLCLWHIIQNATKNLDSLKKWKEIEVILLTVVHEFLDPEEFDEAWDCMLEKFDLRDNNWLKETYALKEQWVPAHNRDKFWAKMASTQSSEGMNRVLKDYVNVDTPLVRFIELYESVMKDLAHKEKLKNFPSVDQPLPVEKTILAEYVFHNKYTNRKFKEVKEEAQWLNHTNITKVRTLGTVSFFKAEEKVPTPIWRKRWKYYNLTIDKEKGDFLCSCKWFEFTRILCKHIIRVIELKDIEFIPEKYILKRWRKDIVRQYEDIQVSYYRPDESQRVLKVRELSNRHKYLSTLALHNEDTFALYK